MTETITARGGLLWNLTERKRLLARFGEGAPLEDLAREHQRTKGAIVSKLAGFDRIVYLPRSGGFHKVDPEPWGFI